MRKALTGSQVVAGKPTLSPEEFGVLAERLTTTSNPVEAARIKEPLTRGFYGI